MRCSVCNLIKSVNRLREDQTFSNLRNAQHIRSGVRNQIASYSFRCPSHAQTHVVAGILAITERWLSRAARELSRKHMEAS